MDTQKEEDESWHCHVCAKKIKPVRCDETVFCGECSSEFVEKITNENNPAEFKMIHEDDDSISSTTCSCTSETCSCSSTSTHTSRNISQTSSPFVIDDIPSPQGESNEIRSPTSNITNQSSPIPNINNLQPQDNLDDIFQAMQSVANALQGINQSLASSVNQNTNLPTSNMNPHPSNSNSLFNSIGNLFYGGDFGSVAMNQFFTHMTGVRSFNPGDYVWGRNMEDTLNHLFNSGTKPGNPPASQQIIDNLKMITISQNHIDSIIDCAICKEEFKLEENVNELPCVHLFHEPCIKKWLTIHNQCPVCRFELVEKNLPVD